MTLVEKLVDKVRGSDKRVALPEGDDVRVVGAARRLLDDGIATPIVLGSR